MKRRHLLKHLGALGGLGLFTTHIMPACAWAQRGVARPHFFIFIFAQGGWDTTMVFDPKMGVEGIDSDPSGETTESHGLPFVKNPNQPAVERFFNNFGHLSCFVNGINSQSISHFLGTQIMLTGFSGGNAPDWPSLIASEVGSDLQLPNMALSGPSFAGMLGRYTFSGSGFLSLLLSEGTDTPPGPVTGDFLDQFGDFRFQGFRERLIEEGRTGWRLDELHDAVGRIKELEAIKDELGSDFGNVGNVAGDIIALSSSMERGYTVTGTVNAPGEWDSHDENWPLQYEGFETLFSGLHDAVEHLASRNATSGSGTLLDQTTLVVLSEMGRTPKLNGTDGKDHWQFTTALMVGAQVKGATVLGGTDDRQNGLKVDYSTGLPDAAGEEVTPLNLGSSLLELLGIDPAIVLGTNVRPFRAWIDSP